jgi:hypothetical protein
VRHLLSARLRLAWGRAARSSTPRTEEREGKKQGEKGEAAGDKKEKKGARIRESREEGQVGFSKGVYAIS